MLNSSFVILQMSWYMTLMHYATALGCADQRTPPAPQRTAKDILRALNVEGRVGHGRALKAAYSAGRFHVRTMGMP